MFILILKNLFFGLVFKKHLPFALLFGMFEIFESLLLLLSVHQQQRA